MLPNFDPNASTSPVNKRHEFMHRVPWGLLLGYAPDWIVTIVVTGLFYLLGNAHGFWRDFSLTDTSIQYNFTEHERVPPYLLVILTLICPLVIMPIFNLIYVRSILDWHNSWLGLILSWGLAGTITNIVKITAGRPRPDLIARCQPAAGSQNAPVFGLVSASICTNTNMAIMEDGFRSFFSGHSSLSFAGLGFLFFYVAGKLHLYDRNGHAVRDWIAFIPLVGAALIAITRTMDYRHHPTDVIAGSLVGIVIAYFCYAQYYPPLYAPDSELPYKPPAIQVNQSNGAPPLININTARDDDAASRRPSHLSAEFSPPSAGPEAPAFVHNGDV